MKKLVYLFATTLFVLGLSLSSCSKDDDNSNGGNNNGQNDGGGNGGGGGGNNGGGDNVGNAMYNHTNVGGWIEGTASNVNVRASIPSGDVLYQVSSPTQAQVIGKDAAVQDGSNYTWYQIKPGSTAGWIRGDFTKNISGPGGGGGGGVTTPTFTPPTKAQLEAFLESQRTSSAYTIQSGNPAIYIKSITVNTYTVDGKSITSSPAAVPENAKVAVKFTVRTILSSGNLNAAEKLHIDNYRIAVMYALKSWLMDQGFGDYNIDITTGNTIFG